MNLAAKTVLTAAAIAATATLQAASIYRVDFSGTITIANVAPGSTDGTINVGTSFSGFYQFNSALPDMDPNSNNGSYTQPTANWFKIDIGSSHAKAPDMHSILVQNDLSGTDYYSVFRSFSTWSGAGTSNGLNVSMSLLLADWTQSALSTDVLITGLPPLSAWNVEKIQIASHQNNPNMLIEGTITSMSIAPVPEPASIAAIIIGIAGARRIKRRR